MSFLILRSGSNSAEADWLLRSGGQDVVWFHDFRSDAEVNAFRWTNGVGNDPNATGNARSCNTRRITTDGVTGACLEILRNAGEDDGSDWWRPYSPIVGSGNGRGIDDPGASGTITPQSYSPTQGGGQIAAWGAKGFYGHSSYHTGSVFDGTEYYLQMRVKMDPRRTTSGNLMYGGKLTYQTVTNNSNVFQELVTNSGGALSGSDVGDTNIFRIYGAAGHNPLEDADSLGRPGCQVGSDLADYNASPKVYCQFVTDDGVAGGTINECWAWSGGWDTIMYHLIPGRDGVQETLLQIYAAHPGQTSYTKIWDETFTQGYEGGITNGYNALICSIYQNFTNNSEFWHRYCQLIFSKSFIPCPQV